MRAASLLSLLLVIPSTASAQTSLQDATGLSYGVATFELGALALVSGIALVSEVTPERDAFGDEVVWGLSAAALVGGTIASSGVGQGEDAPAFAPQLVHQGFVGAGLLAGLTYGIGRLTGLEEGAQIGLSVGGAILGALGAVSYAAVRAERITTEPTDVLPAWNWAFGPTLAAVVGGVIGALLAEEAGLDPGVLALVVGSVLGLVAYGGALLAVETSAIAGPREVIELGP